MSKVDLFVGLFYHEVWHWGHSEVKCRHYLPYCSVPLEFTYTLVETLKITSSEGQHKHLYLFEGFYNNIYPIPPLLEARLPSIVLQRGNKQTFF